VGAHVALEVEVGQLVGLLQLQELGQLGIRVDLAAVLLVLEVVAADILVDLASHLGAGHLRASRLSKESSKLSTDQGGLYETAGRAVATLALALGAGLLSVLHLTGPALLELLELAAKARKKGVNLLHLLSELGSLIGKGDLNSLGLGSGLLNGGLGGDRLGGLGGGLSVLLPSGHYILLMRVFFKCFNANILTAG